MLPSNNIQSEFLSEVKKQLPSNISLADELAETLNISRDSAYRRIRGETTLSLDEIKAICNHYAISLDEILSASSDSVTFRSRKIKDGDFALHDWLVYMLDNLTRMKDSHEKHVFVVARELPFFHFFQYPELAAFKIYFWLSAQSGAKFRLNQFCPDFISKEYLSLAGRISERYQHIPSTEIWSEEVAQVTLRQIEYAFECGFMKNTNVLQKILDQYEQVLCTIQNSCALGTKEGGHASFLVYKNDILNTGNTMLFKMGMRQECFLHYEVPAILSTSQSSFCHQLEENINNMISQADLISASGEKERIRLFNGLHDQVLQTRDRVGAPPQVSFVTPALKLHQA